MKTDALWQLVNDWEVSRDTARNFNAAFAGGSPAWKSRAQTLNECLSKLAFTLRKIDKPKGRKKRKASKKL